MKKKILTFTLSLALAFGLSACGNGATVSGPVDRDPVSNVSSDSGNESSSDDTSSPEASTEESSSDSPETSNALTDWYNGSERTALEDQINNMSGMSGMTFYVEVEEPDTIIYNYKYDEPLDLGDTGSDALQEYFKSMLDSQYQAFLSDIQTYQNSYNLPVTTVRVQYIDSDGSIVYSGDYTEDYVPDSSGSAASPSDTYATLDDWMAGDEQNLIVSMVNEQLASAGLTIDIYADGNILVMDYTYTEQQDLEGYTQEEIDTVFNEQVAPTFSSMVANMFDSFESEYGLVLDDIRLVFRNADGTQLYSSNYSDL